MLDRRCCPIKIRESPDAAVSRRRHDFGVGSTGPREVSGDEEGTRRSRSSSGIACCAGATGHHSREGHRPTPTMVRRGGSSPPCVRTWSARPKSCRAPGGKPDVRGALRQRRSLAWFPCSERRHLHHPRRPSAGTSRLCCVLFSRGTTCRPRSVFTPGGSTMKYLGADRGGGDVAWRPRPRFAISVGGPAQLRC